MRNAHDGAVHGLSIHDDRFGFLLHESPSNKAKGARPPDGGTDTPSFRFMERFHKETALYVAPFGHLVPRIKG